MWRTIIRTVFPPEENKATFYVTGKALILQRMGAFLTGCGKGAKKIEKLKKSY